MTSEHDTFDDAPYWRVRALVAVELAAVAMFAVALAGAGWWASAASRYVPWELLVVVAAFPAGMAARLAVEAPRVARRLREWHRTAARRVLGPPSTWLGR